ncbi:MAG TPA: hypothetical protein VFH63_03400 [candidate division Zixibacteria bacterium]|nr:hypothetical protein [candidate division Zixibacteria bacterium]
MSGSKRPSTSSLRRFITSRPYVTVADVRRRFTLDDPDAMSRIQHDGTAVWIGLPEREATKLQELWERDEVGMELAVEVRAPVVVGIYPMRIARYVLEGGAANGNGAMNGDGAQGNGQSPGPETRRAEPARAPGRGHLPRYPTYRQGHSGVEAARGE